MNYKIFRSQPIMTINDLAQIGLHIKEKKVYKSNSNIKLELSKNNTDCFQIFICQQFEIF